MCLGPSPPLALILVSTRCVFASSLLLLMSGPALPQQLTFICTSGSMSKALSLCTLFFLCEGIFTPSVEHRSPPSCPRLQPAKEPLPAG